MYLIDVITQCLVPSDRAASRYPTLYDLSFRLVYNKHFFSFVDRFDEGHDGFLDLNEVKRMMERLGAPQTHLGLKAMISEVDEDGDSKISFREFLLIYRYVCSHYKNILI